MTGPTADPDGRPMADARSYLSELGLPDRDLGELPTSAKRFPDDAQYQPAYSLVSASRRRMRSSFMSVVNCSVLVPGMMALTTCSTNCGAWG
jgi:hypothetical protein